MTNKTLKELMHPLKAYEKYLIDEIKSNKERSLKYLEIKRDLEEENLILKVKKRLYVFFPELKDYSQEEK